MAEDEKPLLSDRVLWLQRLAGLRNERELRGVAERIELELQRRSAQADYEQYDRDWRGWWDARREERAADLHARVHAPAHHRHELAEANLRAQQARATAAAAENQRLSEARERALAEEKAVEAARREAEREAREAHQTAIFARAREKECNRIENELRRQDSLSQRRAGVMASLAAERERRSQAQQARDEEAEARVQNMRQRLEAERQQRESILDADMARISRMDKRRSEIVQEMAGLRRDTAHRTDVLREMAEQAFVSNRPEPLRRALDAIACSRPGSPSGARTIRPPGMPRAPPGRSRPSSAGSRRPASAGTTLRPACWAPPKDGDARRPVPPPLTWFEGGRASSESASTELPSTCHGSTGETVSVVSPRREGSETASTGEAGSVHE